MKRRQLSIFDIGRLPTTSVEVEQPQQMTTDMTTERLRQNAARILQENQRLEAEENQRRQAGAERINAVRERCTPEEFQRVEATIRANSKPNRELGWSESDIIDGTAYEATYRGQFE